MHILSSSHECPDTLEHANFLSDVLTIVKPLLFTDESSVSLSKFKDGAPYTHTVVVKSYVKQKLTPLQREQVETEAQLLSTLTHEHVAPLLAAVEDARAIHLIMPWCDGGDLRQHMASLRVPPPSPVPRPLPQNNSATTSIAYDQRTCPPPPLSLNAATSNISHHSHHHTQATVCSDGGGGVHCCTGASQHNQRYGPPNQKGFECVGNADSSSSSETNNVDSTGTSTSSSCSSSSSSSIRCSSSGGSCEVEARLRDFLLHPLLRALALLQQQGIVHRDISPKNILVHQGKAKLSDFGLSVHVPPPAPSTQGDVYVTDPSTNVAAASAARSSSAGNSGPSPPDPALCNSLGSLGNKLGSSSNLGTDSAFPASALSSPFSTSAPCSAFPASAPSSVSRLESTLRDSIDSGCSSGSGSSHSGVLLGCDTPQAQGTLIGTLHDDLQQQQRHQQTTSLAHTVHKEPALPEEQQNQQQQQQQLPRPSHAHTLPEKSWLPRTRSSPELMSSVSGTPLYAAPEVLQAVFRNQQVHPNIHHKNDVWALGVIAVEALTGRHPFSQGGVGMAMQGGPSAQAWCPGYGSSSGSSDANVLFSISSGQQLRLPPQLSPECADLLSAMLQRDPAQRATASQLLTHPFITRVRKEAGGGHALAHHKVSPFKHVNGELPPRPPPPRS